MTSGKPAITCTATAKSTGETCGNPRVPGAQVCRIHGGAAPQVKAAAARRVLEALVGPALIKLRELLEDEDTPAHVRFAAVKDILDRTGYKPVEQVEVLTMDMIEREIARLEAELSD